MAKSDPADARSAPDERTAQQIAWETRRRAKLGPPTIAAGVVYLISVIIGGEALHGVPDVGVVQGLTPALTGIAVPKVSPRTQEVIFISHHALGLIAGGALAAIAVAVATFAVLFLFDATRFRRPETLAAGRPLALIGGIAVAVVSLAGQIVNAIATHNFAVSANHSNSAADTALTSGPARVIIEYATLLAGLCFLVGIVITSLNAMRTGLVNRLVGYLGMVAGVLFVLPLGETLSLLSTLWLVGLGVLYIGKWPNGDPPAWAAGEAVAWPSSASLRQARLDQVAAKNGAASPNGSGAAATVGARGNRRRGAQPQQAPAVAAVSDAPPEPTAPRHPSSNKRKRRRGPRQS